MNRRLVAQLAGSLVVGAALLALVMRPLFQELSAQGQSPWQALGDAFVSVSPGSLVVYGLLFLVVHVTRVWRWVVQVQPLGESDRRLIFRVCAIGYAAIVAFPFRIGEVVRPYLLARESDNVGFEAALGTAVTERVIDGLVITGLLFVAVWTAPIAPGPAVLAAGTASAVVFASATVGLVLFVVAHDLAVKLLHGTIGRVSAGLANRLESMLEGFVEGLRSLGRSGTLVPFFVLTAVYWGVNALGIWWLARSFGLMVPLYSGLGLLAVLVVGLMVPGAPGFLGNFQLALDRGLRLYLGDAAIGATGLAFALTMNVIQLVLQIGFAVPFLARSHIGVRGLVDLQQQASDARPDDADEERDATDA